MSRFLAFCSQDLHTNVLPCNTHFIRIARIRYVLLGSNPEAAVSDLTSEKGPDGFPPSVVLCGVRGRAGAYRIRASSEKEVITGGGVFSIKAKSLPAG